MKDIEKLIGRKVPVLEDHPFPMQVFEAPKRDKNGKIINEEDAEARAAARQLKRERDQVRQAAEKEKRQKELERQQAAAQVLEQQEPTHKSRRRRRKKPAEGENTAAMQATEREEQEAEEYLPQRPKLTRPGTLMDTGDAMPNTEFSRPNPFDSDIIMDATARLLAPRRSVYGSSEAARPQKGERSRQKKSGGQQPKHREESAPAQEKTPSGQKHRGGKKPHQAQRERTETQKNAPAKGGAPRQKQKNNRRSNAGRSPVEPFRSGQTKDSTEQASLIKPFYINVGR